MQSDAEQYASVVAGAHANGFLCDICNKTYTRSEHLARHLRMHASERPFSCKTCGKGFTRRDLLSRHTTIHKADGQQPRTSTLSRKHRTMRACAACAQAKLRCSNTRPCDRCHTKGIVCEAHGHTAVTRDLDTGPIRLALDSVPPVQLSDASPCQQQQAEVQHHLSHETHTQNRLARATSPLAVFDSVIYNDALEPFLSLEAGFDDTLMGNFLYDVIDADPGDDGLPSFGTDTLPDVLHFGFDENAYLSSSLSIGANAFAPPPFMSSARDRESIINHRGDTGTTAVRRAALDGEQAFRESMWLWNPSLGDSSVSEQIHLALPRQHSIEGHQTRETAWSLQLSNASRDRLLSMIFTVCEPQVQRQVVSGFPSTEFLSNLIIDFKTRHACQISPWIHFSSLDLNNECEEFLAALICAGAVDSKRAEIHKLGLALQEAARLAIMKKFEEDNRCLRELRFTQAMLLVLQVGLNSASRRKIEIAESLTLFVVTMLRRGGRFRSKQTDSPRVPAEGASDRSQTLEVLWRKWIEEESFKRLVQHVLFQDVQTSSALFRQPVIAYSEINLTMPCPEDIWQAEAAELWHQKILVTQGQSDVPPLTLQKCIQDPGLLNAYHAFVDVQMSLRLVVSNFYSRVWQFSQMRATCLLQINSLDLATLTSFRQQLVANSQDLILRFSNGPQSMHPCVRMMLDIALMHLHVSLEDVQLLAGKEGEDQARKAASRLRSWISLPESRQALFHAGQVAKTANECPLQFLRGFHATMIYHASLTMWAYALLATSQINSQNARNLHFTTNELSRVQIDSEETPEMRRFILIGDGIAYIQRYPPSTDTSRVYGPAMVPLTDAAEVMMSMAGLLSSRDDSDQYCIPIVSYLTRLMRSLAKASTAMRLLRLEKPESTRQRKD